MHYPEQILICFQLYYVCILAENLLLVSESILRSATLFRRKVSIVNKERVFL